MKTSYTDELITVKKLLTSIAEGEKPQMRWMWGEALFGWSLALMDEYMQSEDYTPFLTGFADWYTKHPPRVDYADTAAPALITYYIQKKTGRKDIKALTDRVLNYILYEPRIMDDAVNHLGKSPEGWFYPKSIWVDSLMMFSVFPALYGRENNNRELVDLAARQPGLYASYMQDPEDKLWYHSYWVKSRRPYPGRKLFWGRGNGWVISSLPKILDNIPKDHKERADILRILKETADAAIEHQNPNGSFSTLIGIKSYEETSATALIADGLLHAVNSGYLKGEKYRKAGLAAFSDVLNHIKIKNGKYHLTGISAPTIPLQLFPRTCYLHTVKRDDFKYGLAAAAFAAIEYDKMMRNR